MTKAEFFKGRRATLIIAGLTLLVLLLSIPGSLREAYNRGGFYLFSQAFFEDLPKRLAGPGRFRFILQPLTAIILGVINGRRDAFAGKPPYLYALLFRRKHRRDMVSAGFAPVFNLVLMGILIDAVCQRIILGIVYPGAAIAVGPVLIGGPYLIARISSNRLTRHMKHSEGRG